MAALRQSRPTHTTSVGKNVFENVVSLLVMMVVEVVHV